MKKTKTAVLVSVAALACALSLAMCAGCISVNVPAKDNSTGEPSSAQTTEGKDAAKEADKGASVAAAPQDSDDIGVDKAKEIALANVSGSSADQIVKAERDYDDGILRYDVKIVVGETEYEFEIRASDGTILESSQESIYD